MIPTARPLSGLSVGGYVHVNELEPENKTAAALLREAFRLTWVELPQSKQATDDGLAIFKNCKNLMRI